jgi:iron complex outermembrane recepter protein
MASSTQTTGFSRTAGIGTFGSQRQSAAAGRPLFVLRAGLLATTTLIGFATTEPAWADDEHHPLRAPKPLAMPGAVATIAEAGQPTPGAAQQTFAIPPQPLSSALTQFGRQAGVQIAVDTSLVAGLQTPGVQGRYTPEQALRQLLAGTGLQYRFPDANTVTIERAVEADGEGPLQLAPITVEGWRPSSARGYRPKFVSSATKTEAPLVDVPASVSVVTREVIRDQNARTVAQALRNVAGVVPGPNAANVSVQESFTIRGFTSSLVRLNGVQRRSTGPLSAANIDSVEVLKGPFSVLYGDLSPGGFINVQTKRPEREAGYEITAGLSQVTTGRGTQGSGSVDLTGPLNADGNLLYRFIASAEGGSMFVDEAEREQYFVNPSLAFIGVDDRLRVDLDFSYLKNDETFLFGIPARDDEPDRRLNRDLFLGSDENDKETEDYAAELRARYEVTEQTRIDAALTYHLNEHFSTALRPFGAPGQTVAGDDTVRRSFSLRSFDTMDLQFEANVVHELTWGVTDWRFLAGADVRRTTVDDSGPGSGNILNFDRVEVLAPVTDVALPSPDDPAIVRFDRSSETADAYGAYAQAEVWLYDRLKLLVGARYSQVDYVFEDNSGLRFEENPDSIDPRFGALFKLTPSTSLYGSYSTSFEQSFSFDPDNSKPLEAEQFEIGVKQEFFDGRAYATVALFDITQENLSTTDPDTGLPRQIGETSTRGVEVELSGEVLPGLNVIASYAYLDNEITKDNDGNEGNRLPNVPEHAASIWANYEVFARDRERLTIGGGVFYVGERFTSARNGVVMPEYATVDVAVGYEFEAFGTPVSIRAGVKNLFDEDYFTSGFGEGIAFPGDPRTAWVRIGARF